MKEEAVSGNMKKVRSFFIFFYYPHPDISSYGGVLCITAPVVLLLHVIKTRTHQHDIIRKRNPFMEIGSCSFCLLHRLNNKNKKVLQPAGSSSLFLFLLAPRAYPNVYNSLRIGIDTGKARRRRSCS